MPHTRNRVACRSARKDGAADRLVRARFRPAFATPVSMQQIPVSAECHRLGLLFIVRFDVDYTLADTFPICQRTCRCRPARCPRRAPRLSAVSPKSIGRVLFHFAGAICRVGPKQVDGEIAWSTHLELGLGFLDEIGWKIAWLQWGCRRDCPPALRI